METQSHRNRMTDLPNQLERVPILAGASAKAMRAALPHARHFSVPGGAPLFEIGDPSDAIYFVLSGSLGAFRRGMDGRMELIGHIRAGEPVGEVSLLAGEPHQNTVFALRDTEVVGLPKSQFLRLAKSDSEILERLIRFIVVRLRQTRKKSMRAEPRVFALISTSPTIDVKLRARALADALEKLGQRVVIVGEEASGQPSEFFDALEAQNNIVMLMANIGDTPWYKLVLRHADRIWLLARADAHPSTPLMPDDPSPARGFRLVDVILLKHVGTRQVASPGDWKKAAGAARLFHWEGLNDVQTSRLARVIAGRSIGLVLSGGGARAYAHIGVIRALREARCPIDFIGGASMGAVVAACVACGWDDDEIDMRIRQAFVEDDPLNDYNLPVVALVKGAKVDARLNEHFGERVIEELEIPFFAVSSNLSTGEMLVHFTGRLRDALRASISLPGILPPVVVEGDVLVDGAVTNNFPVDVMCGLHRGRTIGVDVAQGPHMLPADQFIDPPGFAKWTLSNGLKAPPPIASLLMRTATINMNPKANREMCDLLISPELEGVELRSWKEYDSAVSAGYDAAVKALSELRGPLSGILRSSPDG